jgi:hypothetical protein
VFTSYPILGLKEAAEAFKVWKEFRENKEQLELAKESKKPAPFKMVKVRNVYCKIYEKLLFKI